MKFVLFYMMLCIYSCSSSNKDDRQKIYNNRGVITHFFLSKSILRSRGQNIILFYTHNKSKTNKYIFEINNNQYSLIKDSLEYTPDLLELTNERGSKLYKKELVSQLKVHLNKMDEMNIRDISSEMAGVGIELKIYMKSQAVFLYVPNLQIVPRPRFKEYIDSMKKLNDNWYYKMKE